MKKLIDNQNYYVMKLYVRVTIASKLATLITYEDLPMYSIYKTGHCCVADPDLQRESKKYHIIYVVFFSS